MKKHVIIVGIIVILLTCISLNGCVETFLGIENKPPFVAIYVDSISVYRTQPILVTIDSYDTDGVVISCLVNFGDGTIISGFNHTHIYNEAGTYVIIANVTDNDGGESSSNITIIVKEPFTIKIGANVTRGVFPLTVAFNGIAIDAIGNITGYLWDFQDGSTSSEQHPIHTFKILGQYIVKLTAFNDRGENISDTITIITEHRPYFQLSGKIVNNYNRDVDVDIAFFDNWGGLKGWNYWAPTVNIGSYEEKQFSYSVKGGIEEYLIMAQWFYPNTNKEGCEICLYKFSNPSVKDLTYYFEIKKDGEMEISTTYHPPNPPKTPEIPEIIDYNIYSTSYYTYVFGKIKNVDSSSITSVSIEITLYDLSNNVISKKTVYPFIFLIGTQQISSFSATFYEDYYHHYDVKIKSFETTNEHPYSGIVITDHYMEIDWIGWLHVKGELKNTGSQALKFTKVNAVFYDSDGNILTTKYDSVGDLYSGEEESFEIKLYSSELDKLPSSISSYDLEIDYRIK